MSVFNKDNKNFLTSTLFLGEELGIQRYEQVKWPVLDKMVDKQLSFFWRPEEVELSKDAKDFKELTPHEQHIFISNIKRQTLLDSIQGRSPSLALLPITTLPELEAWIDLWSMNETLHSRSYTHIIRNVFSDPTSILDEIMDIEEIVDCSIDVSKYYNDLLEYGRWYSLLGEGTFTVTGQDDKAKTITISEYELKKKIWLTILSVNCLEGLRFYCSFACSWAFVESKKMMEGNAKIIKLICRDENLHLGFTQTLLKILPKDDPDFEKISKECEEEAIQMFKDVVDQEKEWAAYLFKDGSMLGLNEDLLCDYIEWIAYKRMRAINLPSPYTGGSNPLPWTVQWIQSGEAQPAPQEVEISSYTIGAVNMDVEDGDFSDFDL